MVWNDRVLPRPELTLIANVALDRVNGGPWTWGGARRLRLTCSLGCMVAE